VRAALREGEHHRDLRDEWADQHYIEVRARRGSGPRPSAAPLPRRERLRHHRRAAPPLKHRRRPARPTRSPATPGARRGGKMRCVPPSGGRGPV